MYKGGVFLDIKRYRYIAVLARTNNVTKAAEELHISQPALTKAIKKTEEELGVTLFHRDTMPFRLTYAGECFLREIRKILNVQDTLEKGMSDIAAGRRGKITIGLPVESASTWLPMILPEFVEARPEIEIEIVEGNSDSLEKGILDGRIDFSIYTLPVHSDDLDYEVVEEHAIFLLSSNLHPFARRADPQTNSLTSPQYIDPQDLNGEKFLTLTPDRGMYRVAMQILERHGITANIVLQLTSNYTISTLAAVGLGLCFTTYSAALRMATEPYLHPVFYTVDDPVFMRKTIVAYRKGNCLSPSAQELLKLVKHTLGRLPRNEIVVRHDP